MSAMVENLIATQKQLEDIRDLYDEQYEELAIRCVEILHLLKEKFNPFEYEFSYQFIRDVFKPGSIEYRMAYNLFCGCPPHTAFEYVEISEEYQSFSRSFDNSIIYIVANANRDYRIKIAFPVEYFDFDNDRIVTEFKRTIVDPLMEYDAKSVEVEKAERAELDRLMKKYGVE